MLNARIPAMRNQALISISLFVLGLWLAWEIGGKLVADDMRSIIYGALILGGCVAAVMVVRNWRTGFYMFLVWMLFEDLVRKYMGNGLVLFFGKDILLGLVYLSFFIAARKGREKVFRSPFLIYLSLFIWLGVLQVFNQNSPSIWYGLLGFKVYFYYIPLLYVGYALIRTDEELTKFLAANAVLAVLISALGIVQAIVGNSFLNPQSLAPDLETLGNLQKSTLSGHLFNLPDSIFVSSGRYAEYLDIAFIVVLGAAGYLLLSTSRKRKLIFAAVGLLGVAALLSGNRGSFLSILMTATLLSFGFLWGAPWRWRQAHRMVKAIRRSALIGTVGFVCIFFFFPEQSGSRLEYFTETLLPSGANYQLGTRAWDYPIQNLLFAFSQPNWELGNGIGTAALGTQYVAKLVGIPPPAIGVEEGYGTLIVEMGIVAPFLWILWTFALLYYSWRVIHSLRETRLFPVGLAMGWYALLLLFIWTFGSLAGYENYVCNAFLWLLVGVLFRLPDLLLNAPKPVAVPLAWRHVRGGLQF
jgi:hypothetical protein